MTKILMAVQSYNRFHTLRLAFMWLKKHPPKSCTLAVYDDGSTDKALRCYLERAVNSGFIKHLDMQPPRAPAPSKALADSRCGTQRKRIVDYFLEHPEYDYLFLMDDDILLEGAALSAAVGDYEMLRTDKENHIGALTLHAWCGIHSQKTMGGKLFSLVKISGESVLLMHRESLEKCGNNFGPQPRGFADTQWNAIRTHGLQYYTRLSPPYQAQHIGVGEGGSVIHRKMPFWVVDCWRDLSMPRMRERAPYIPCPGFDPVWFMEIVRRKGNRAACEELYRRVLTYLPPTEVGVAKSTPPAVESSFPRAEEKASVTVRHRGKVVKEIRI